MKEGQEELRKGQEELRVGLDNLSRKVDGLSRSYGGLSRNMGLLIEQNVRHYLPAWVREVLGVNVDRLRRRVIEASASSTVMPRLAIRLLLPRSRKH